MNESAITLRSTYLDLINHQLPQAAQSGEYPVRFNHCFARIILDTICGEVWYRAIAKPAYRHMTEAQLEQAIALAQEFLHNPQACWAAQRLSLQYRGRLSPS